MGGGVLKGMALHCALDDRTCLECLELDGKDHEVPVHEGCRCVVVPVTKSWAELMGRPETSADRGTRSSALGQVPSDGGLYKEFLIRKRHAIRERGGLTGETLGALREWLAARVGLDASSSRLAAAIGSMLVNAGGNRSTQDLLEVLRNVPWNMDHSALFSACAHEEEFAALDVALSRMKSEVPEGAYAGRHRGMLYRQAGTAAKTKNQQRAIDYLQSATEADPDNVAVLVELAQLQRRAACHADALRTLHRALALKPTHKAALRELARLGKVPSPPRPERDAGQLHLGQESQ